MKVVTQWFFAGIILLLPTSMSVQAEEIWVVVNKDADVSSLSRSEIINIYMGRQKTFATGGVIKPLETTGNNSVKEFFYQQLVNRQVAEINAYWARLVFSGQGAPPEKLNNYTEITNRVLTDTAVIGYIPESMVTDGLRVVYKLRK